MDQRFNEAVNRLEKERSEHWNKWGREGEQDGREWALQASYEELELVAGAAEDYFDSDFDHHHLPTEVASILLDEAKLKEEPLLDREDSAARGCWRCGWLDRVLSTWFEIQEELTERDRAREKAAQHDHLRTQGRTCRGDDAPGYSATRMLGQ